MKPTNLIVRGEPLVLEVTRALGTDTQGDSVVHRNTHGVRLTHNEDICNTESQGNHQ